MNIDVEDFVIYVFGAFVVGFLFCMSAFGL